MVNIALLRAGCRPRRDEAITVYQIGLHGGGVRHSAPYALCAIP